ncbi:reverse transcriptase domain-containing protein [Tanacetum coccineum]
MGIVVSTIHKAIKFYTPEGVATVLSTYEPDKTGEGQKKLKETSQEAMKDVINCMNVVEEVFINDKYPDQIVVIGRQLPTSFKKRLRDLLKENINIFAWTYSDMTGIPRTIMVGGKPFITEHRLNELKHIEPRKQKKRGLALERSKALHKEVEDLTKANILREVKYYTWVSNPIMIKKGDEKWKQCVDFRDINKACPKDCYSLSTNDQKIESLAKFWLKCFLDAYKGYHQISMAKGDEEKIARLVDTVFSNQIGQNLEVHVDDMVIKSDSEEDMLTDVQETFDKLRAINMKLNPRKCSFGVEEGQFLGYLIMKRIAKWAIEIGEHHIEFKGRNSIKGHILADFLAETPTSESKKEEARDTRDKEQDIESTWKLYTDGASSYDGSRVGLILVSPEGREYTYALRFEFETTNNEAEYEALLAGQ